MIISDNSKQSNTKMKYIYKGKYESYLDNHPFAGFFSLFFTHLSAFKDNCTVLAFDAGNVHGLPSYVMIHDDRSEIAVYANHGVYPDPGYSFRLPPLFEK